MANILMNFVIKGGLIYVHEWNNMQYAASAAFLLAVYSDYLSASNSVLKCPDAQIQPQELLNFAKSQARQDFPFTLHTMFFPRKHTLFACHCAKALMVISIFLFIG